MTIENIVKKRKRLASILVFAFGILMVVYYIVCKEKVEFDSDFTDTVLWAEAMLTGNGLFDKTMNYAYTLPFGGSLLMAPFVAIFGVGYIAHALGFLVFLAIFVFASYKMMRTMDFSCDASMVATGMILLISLATKNTRMIMWGHVIHYSLGLLFVVVAMGVYGKIDAEGLNFMQCIKICKEGKNLNSFVHFKWVMALAILTALFCTNGLTTILFFAVPFYGAIVTERFIDTDKDILAEENINSFLITVICGTAGMVGFVVSKLLQHDVTTVYEGMFKEISVWYEWVWDITERIRCFIVCFAGEIDKQIPMESITGVRILYMALIGFMVIAIPFVAAFSVKKMENKVMRMLFISYYILLFSTLFVYDFSSARGTPHRLVGLVMTAVIVCVVYAMWLLKDARLSRFGFILVVMLMGACLLSSYCVVALSGQNRYERLAQVLRENDLKYGYAEYWSAQVTTVLSNSDAVVCPIIVEEDGTVSPRYYNVRWQQFDDKEGVDRYFAFMTPWEYETAGVSKDAVEVIPFDDYGVIAVFDHNIF